MSGGHVVDRFLHAAYPDWKPYPYDNGPKPDGGAFHASPEVARMLYEHAHRFGWRDGYSIFSRPVIADPAVPRGEVRFVPPPPVTPR